MILKKVKNEVGATAIEYGLIASLIGVLAVSGMSAVGMNLKNTYCTISKHLGGSGTCSGGGSSETGSGGSPAGSGNSTTGNEGNNSTIPTSITTKDDMDKLKNSLVDNFDDSYLDSNLGGTNGFTKTSVDFPNNLLSMMTDYNKKHPNDQITNVFGLYDALTHQPITSWSKASQGLSNGKNIYTGKNNNYDLEVTTQQGHVYNIDSDYNKITPQLQKGP